jgi:hypothetical protein
MENKRRFRHSTFFLKKLLIAEGQVRYNQREVRQREAARGLAAWPFQLERMHIVFLLEREDLCTSLLLCPAKIFRQGN